MSYGHALKTNGSEADSVAAYEKSIALLPSLGEAYWSLANLKTVRFTGRADRGDADGNSHEPRGSPTRIAFICTSPWARRWRTRAPTESFEHYAKGNSSPRRAIRLFGG